MQTMATRRQYITPAHLQQYTRVNSTWHILKVNGGTFFGRSAAEVYGKARVHWSRNFSRTLPASVDQ